MKLDFASQRGILFGLTANIPMRRMARLEISS
jgi:hypothetical protein